MLTLAHLLVFVYWLGGDLGAFCASYYATDWRRTPAERALALALVNAVDTAPAAALVLALPTGVALAISRGWLAWGWPAWAALATASAGWLVIALAVHRNPAVAAGRLARVDRAIRWTFVGTLLVAGALGVVRAAGYAAPVAAPPLFIGLKLWLLAASAALGLAIRRPLRTFVAAFADLARSGSTPALERICESSMARCRRYVIGIWMCLLAAAALGVWKPL